MQCCVKQHHHVCSVCVCTLYVCVCHVRVLVVGSISLTVPARVPLLLQPVGCTLEQFLTSLLGMRVLCFTRTGLESVLGAECCLLKLMCCIWSDLIVAGCGAWWGGCNKEGLGRQLVPLHKAAAALYQATAASRVVVLQQA